MACVRHIVVVAVGLLGSLSPGQCSEDVGFQGEAWLSVLRQEAWWVWASPGRRDAREQGQGGSWSIGLNGHKILFPSLWPGASRRGLWSWAELVARAKAQSWRPDHRRHNRGVWEVEGQSPRLGRHIDVPERDGATGGLVPK